VRGLISLVIVAVTVVFQLTVVDRIAFPGGSGPDLVLVVVAALALASGPLAGAVIGFWAGLALDVAPPGSHFTGQDALVFCLIGYACGLLADDSSSDSMTEPGHTALFEIVVTAVGAICGEALVALLGVMLSDPRVTWPAITHVLPVAVVYDVLLCPFVLYAAAAAWRLAGARSAGTRAAWSPARGAAPGPGAGQGAVRRAAIGSVPRLRLSDTRRGHGAIGGTHGPGAGRRPGAGREPRLKLGRAAPGHSMTGVRGFRDSRSSLGAAFATGGSGGSPRVRFGSRRREGVLGGSMLGGSRPGGSALRTSRFSGSHLGRSLLGGSVFSHAPTVGLPGRGSAFARSAPLGRSSPFRHRSQFKNPSQFKNTSQFRNRSRLSNRGQLKSPGRGWLRGSARGLNSARGRHPLGPARLHMPRPKARRRWRPRRWRTGGYR
jgi:rod shape-determining protein MreD